MLTDNFEVNELVLERSSENSFDFLRPGGRVKIFRDTPNKDNMILKLTKINVVSFFKIDVVPISGVSPKLEYLKVNDTAYHSNKGVAVCQFCLITLNI